MEITRAVQEDLFDLIDVEALEAEFKQDLFVILECIDEVSEVVYEDDCLIVRIPYNEAKGSKDLNELIQDRLTEALELPLVA